MWLKVQQFDGLSFLGCHLWLEKAGRRLLGQRLGNNTFPFIGFFVFTWWPDLVKGKVLFPCQEWVLQILLGRGELLPQVIYSLPFPLKFNIDTQNDTMIFRTHHVWYPCLMVEVDPCITSKWFLEANPPPNDQISVEILSLKLA